MYRLVQNQVNILFCVTHIIWSYKNFIQDDNSIQVYV